MWCVVFMVRRLGLWIRIRILSFVFSPEEAQKARKGGGKSSEFRVQSSEFRFQISDFRFEIFGKLHRGHRGAQRFGRQVGG